MSSKYDDKKIKRIKKNLYIKKIKEIILKKKKKKKKVKYI